MPRLTDRETLLAAARGERVESDADTLLASAAAEGMIGLVARSATLASIGMHIQAMAVENAARLRLDELARIVRAFEAAGIRLLTMKGAVLSQQLYGDPALRAFNDLDVIAAPEDADRGEAVLRELGYRESEPIDRAQLKTYRRFNSAALFVHDDRNVLADFHWSFSHQQFPLRLSFDEVWARRQQVQVGPTSFATFGEADLAVMTCSHAAKHLWYRLEMLAQIAALARRPVDWSEVERLAIAVGASKQVGLSFLLARDILGVALPPVAQCLQRAEPVFERVRRIVERNLFARRDRRADATGLDHLLLLDRRRDAFRSLAMAVFVPTYTDWRASRLPASLQWILRPPRLIWRRAAKYLSSWLS